MNYDPTRAHALLRTGSGDPTAIFREGQEEAIRHVVEGRGRLLVVQKTGWGKSFVYFIATKLLREADCGPALLISPLLSLMRNQLVAAERMGVRAKTINSENQDEWEEVERVLGEDEVDILLISPERLANEGFRERVLSLIAPQISLLVIDEAHCVSDWGHDFRPHYRQIGRMIRHLPTALRLLATTATANNRVMEDLRDVLGPSLEVSRGDLSRPSLLLQTIRLPDQTARLAWLAERIPALPGSGIVYTLTIRDAELVASWLKARSVNVEAYTGQTGHLRPELEQALTENRVKALVATTALGMGFDKPDLTFVIHYQSPSSVVAYYQQVGRAGRAVQAAYGVLLSGREEKEITDHFIEGAFPTKEEVQEILEALEATSNGLSDQELTTILNVGQGRIRKALDLLSLESPAPLAKQGTRWQLTAASLDEGFWHRTERLTSLRRAEKKQMQEYVQLSSGHMEFLIRALDGVPGSITTPTLQPLPVTPSSALIDAARLFIQRMSFPIKPRKMWPGGGMPALQVRGKIPEALCAELGRALCMWGDAGWSQKIRRGMYIDGHLPNDLVDACYQLLQEWAPQPTPTWVTCLPSTRYPNLVPNFAERLSNKLSLPFQLTLEKTAERPEQKTMANSAQQARNVDGALRVFAPPLPGPVLLVDDLINSGWTFTVAAYLLRKAGSGEVFPLALAKTGNEL